MTVISEFTCLVESSEPVPSNRGSWGMREPEDLNLRNTPCYRHYEDENKIAEKIWHTSKDDVTLSTHSGNFNVETPSPNLNKGSVGNGPPTGYTAEKVFKKNINSLKKKIKHFEEEFETTFGYRPSKSEKMKHKDIKKYMSELSKARKEHKQMTDGVTGIGMREEEDSNHRTASCYNHYEDENSVVVKSRHTNEDNVVVSHHSGSFSVETQSPHLNHGSGGNDLPTGQTTVKVLKKDMHTLKKKIKYFEEEFETSFGYRPSKSEKRMNIDIKKYMSELSKAHKELKQMKTGVTGLVTASSTLTLSHLRCQESTTSAGAASTLQQAEEKLKEERSACGRKENMSEMTFNELQEEKTTLQKILLYYENIHGRPKTKEDRYLARPLYDRYRQCKRYILKAGSRAKENIGDLARIIEHETSYFTLISPQHHDCIYQEERDKTTPTTPIYKEDTPLNPSHIVDKKEKSSSLPLGNLHSLPTHELKNRKKEGKEEKKRLRKTIRDFEEQFESEYGRKFQKEDRGPLEQTYLDYKHSKAKLRLLEALLSKLDATKY